MFHFPLSRKALVGLITLFVLLFLTLPATLSFADPPARTLREAWQHARDVGSYTFTADAVQTLIPRATTAMIGERNQRVEMHFNGDVSLPAQANLTLQIDGDGFNAAPMQLIQDGTQTTIIQNGESVPIENPAGAASLSTDYLAYLAAAENVTQVTDSNGDSHFTFDINGAKLAEHLRRQMQASLDANPAAGGATASVSPMLVRMHGHGELWLNDAGLPARQTIAFDLPRADENFDARVNMDIHYHFSAIGNQQSAAGGQFSVFSILPAKNLKLEPRNLKPASLNLFIIAALMVFFTLYFRRKWFYRLVATTVIASMVLTPALRILGFSQFQAAQAKTVNSFQSSVFSEQSPSTQSPLENAQRETRNLQQATLACGDGESDEDTDGDGLADSTENCLGTNPYRADTDNDTITDTVEIDGWTINGTVWTTDPFKPDSNDDGLADFVEIPKAEGGNAPDITDADPWDPDGDGVPNIWDSDNDGDGVPDNLDQSPFSMSEYAPSLSFASQNDDDNFDGYEYIEMQIQPQNTDHLRYGATPLDWPHDEEGQLQNLDDSYNDVRLTPMLRIQTNAVPNRELGKNYGVSYFKNEGEGAGYTMYATLFPVSDGGNTTAFYTKVAYDPAHIDNINWKSIELIWTVAFNNDESVNGKTETTPIVIQTYTEDAIRMTGLTVTKSRNVQNAIIGTPNQTDDRYIFNLLLGMSSTFLTHQNPDLDEIETRFTGANTDIAETWGVTNTLIAIDRADYAHIDVSFPETSTRIPNFLDAHGYSHDDAATLIIATQQETGLFNMDERAQRTLPTDINIKLNNIAMATDRNLQSRSYQNDDGDWVALSLADTLDVAQNRHDDLSSAMDALHDDYPDITTDDLRALLNMFYTAWFVGQTRTIIIDGAKLAPENSDDQAVYKKIANAAASLPEYLVRGAHLGVAGGGLRIGKNQADTWQYQYDEKDLYKDWGLSNATSSFFDDDTNFKLIGIRKSVSAFFNVLNAVQCSEWAVKGTYHGLTGLSKAVKSFGWATRMKFGIRVLGVMGAVSNVVFIWVQFGITAAHSDNPIVKAYAAAYAVAATIVTLVLFAISLFPIGAILVAILVLIDMIVYWATGGKVSILESVIRGLAKVFYDVKTLTKIHDFDFVNFHTRLLHPDDGLIPGNRFQIIADFNGDIVRTSGDRDDLNDSWIKGYYIGRDADGVDYAPKNSSISCHRDGRHLKCTNTAKIEYKFTKALRNVELYFKQIVKAKTMVKKRILFVSYRDDMRIKLPDDLDKSDRWEGHTLYLDIVPTSLDDLWNWSDIRNYDPDGDGWNTYLGDVDPNNWDTDGDGLSDKFEHDWGNSDPQNADTDGDGLNDGLEYRIGTKPDDPDSDDDGLTDSEEIRHWNGSAWVGGWDADLPDHTPVHVYSDPLNADTDDDGLNDAAERDNRTSPFAANTVPRLTLTADPTATAPNGDKGVFAAPGTHLTFEFKLYNSGIDPVTDRLTLCLPDFLTNAHYPAALSGDRTPATEGTGDCTEGASWNFAADNLQRFETVTATITADIDGGLGASAAADATLTLPYPVADGSDSVSTQVNVTADADNPAIAIDAPADGTLLGNGTTDYVIGGSASDASSWIDHVEIDLPAGAGTVTTDENNPWAYTWHLPADGDYSLTARAIDFVGHTATDNINVRVDNTAPAADIDLADGAAISGDDGGDVITVTLTGTANDNLSGLARVQIRTDTAPWRTVWDESGFPTAANWSADWVLPNDKSAQGEHRVMVRAIDRAHNIGAAVERNIIVDVLPPTDELTDRSFSADPVPYLQVGQPYTLTGSANDVGNAPVAPNPKELVGERASVDDATIWVGLSPPDDNQAGIFAAWVGDFNGDRMADYLIGLPAAENGRGRVTLMSGRAGDFPLPPTAESLADSRTSFVGTDGAGIGSAIAPASDVNGDGFADFLIGDSHNHKIFIVFGNALSLGQDLTLSDGSPVAWSEIVPPAGGNFGNWLAGAGDVNGDGLADILAADDSTGAVYLQLGTVGAWADTIEPAETAAVKIDVSAGGTPLAIIGDMDGDNKAEFALADGNTVYLFAGDNFAAGNGSPNRTLALGDAIASFTSDTTRPQIVAPGDVNGDGLSDFIFQNGSAPTVVLGDGGRNFSTQRLSRTPAADGFLAAAGDVTGDGLADILLGNNAGDAFLISGDDPSGTQATLADVQSGASAPYLGGADINSDGADDLLLIPSADARSNSTARVSVFGETARINSENLPLTIAETPAAVPQSFAARATASILRVDDDGCSGCFTDIQAAVDAATAGDTIAIEAGGYPAFSIIGKNDLTLRGENPDLVFVDGDSGDFAVKLQNADGIRLENLTLRNADAGVLLDSAGADTAPIVVSGTLIYGVDAHAISMDRTSVISVAHSTLAANDAHLGVTGDPDPAFAQRWETLSTDARAAATDGDMVATADGVWIQSGTEQEDLYHYLPQSNTWESIHNATYGNNVALASTPNGDLWSLRADAWGGFDGTVESVLYISDNEIYAGGNFHTAGGNPIDYIARWDGSAWIALNSGAAHPDSAVHVIKRHSDGSLLVGSELALLKYDGSWYNLGNTDDGGVYAIAEDTYQNDGDIYVGGTFGSIGGIPTRRIAKIDAGGTWHYLGGQFRAGCNGIANGTGIYDMAISGSSMIVAGQFWSYYASGGSGSCGVGSPMNIAAIYLSGSHQDEFHYAGNDWDHRLDGYHDSIYQIEVINGDGDILLAGDIDCANYDYGSPRHCVTPADEMLILDQSTRRFEEPAFLKAHADDGDNVRAFAIHGDSLYIGGNFTQAGGSTAANRVARYDNFPNEGGSWHTVDTGVDDGTVYALAENGNRLFVGGDFTQIDGAGAQSFSYYHNGTFSRQRLYRYDNGGWHQQWGLPAPLTKNAAMAATDDNTLYVLTGDSATFYRYTIDTHTWDIRTDLPVAAGAGASLLWHAGYLYAPAGGNGNHFYRYNPTTNGWSAMADAPFAVGAGSQLAATDGDWLYAAGGGNGTPFARYHVAHNEWEMLSTHDTPSSVAAGGGLGGYGHALYGIPGDDTAELWKFSFVGTQPTKIWLDNVAFVAPENAATFEWISMDGVSDYDLTRQPDDFGIFGADNAWIGGSGTTWTPAPVTDPPLANSQTQTLAGVAMPDTAYHDYHHTDSGFTAGYHTASLTETTVSAGESIQTAIDSGAQRVLVEPGIYQENIVIPGGVELIGAGADNTILQPPAGADWLISAEGVVHSSISGIALDGTGQNVVGIRADDNAEYLLGQRLLIKNTGTAIAAADSRTDLELVNLNIVKNTAGIAATNCAPIDTRNTIFAFNTGTALSYETCAKPQSHQYNLYWENGTDISPAEPGAAELFLNPLFRNVAADDFRTEDDSPVVDAGNPLDPAPPGTGQRVDIGYLEQGRAALYVDDDYCQTCLNDGLSWGVDAFDDIQPALDKAAENLQFYADPAAANYTIGVAAGNYGAADMPSYVRLIGTDAADVHITGTDFGVRFAGATHAEVQNATIGCTACTTGGIISATNTSNAITVTRNIIYKDGCDTNSVVFDARSSGNVTFNTLIANVSGCSDTHHSDGVVARDVGTWVNVTNNIFNPSSIYGFYYALHTSNNGSILEDYNNFSGTIWHEYQFYDDDGNPKIQNIADNDIIDPQGTHTFVDFDNQDYRLNQVSPAIDAADPTAPVPPGGGRIADMGYWEYREPLAAQATILLGRFDRSTALGNSGVQSVEFGMKSVSDAETPVTDTLPSTWQNVALDSVGETQSYWDYSITPATEGYYRLYSRATDDVGNAETDNSTWYTGAFIADGTPPVITLTTPADGASVTSPLELRAEVSDFNAGLFTVDDFYFDVDGERHAADWALEAWDEADGQPRVFRTWLTMTTGIHSVFAAANDFAGNNAQTSPVNLTVTAQAPLDILAPTLVITAPTDLVSRHTITFAGTVNDTISGVNGVEISLDNGITWAVAKRTGENWQYVWEAAGEQDYVSYPTLIRATDRAGNVTTAPLTVAIDNVAPRVPPVDFSDPPGTHYDTIADLHIEWGKPLDGSGQAGVLLAVDQISDTVPITPTIGYSITVPLDHAGDWYVHIAGKDQMGNQFTRHFGPWHVGSMADIFTNFADRRQTIITDGKIDEDNKEWLQTEYLDDFERLERDRASQHYHETNDPQQLFTAFAGDALYFGWRGAWWALDGTLWAFFKTNAFIGDANPPMVSQVAPLPFAANAAIEISSPVTGTLWTFDGTSWHSDPGGFDFSQGDSGDTEARIPINLAYANQMQMIAFATDPDTDEPWAVFPSANGLNSVWTEAFSWTNVISATPQLRGVSMPIEPIETPVGVFGAGDVLTNVLRLTNFESFTVPNVSLVLSSTGVLQNQSVSGASCTDCPTGASVWTLGIDQLPPHTSRIVTLTQQLAADLGTLAVATTTVSIRLNKTQLPIGNLQLVPQFAVPFTIPLIVDTQAPQITALPPNGSLVAPGTQTIFGAANDGSGGGIARIEYRLGDTDPWQFANGTKFWTGNIDVPTDVPTVTLQTRARDIYDNIGLQSVWLRVDGTPPTVTLTLPAEPISGTTQVITGTAFDTLGQVDDVSLQFSDDGTDWQSAHLAMPGALGFQLWNTEWTLPAADCEAIPVRAQATDSVGNQSSPTAWQTVTVDNIAPQLSVSGTHAVPVTDTEQIVLAGNVTDGCGVSAVTAEILPPTGTVFTRTATIASESWQLRAVFDITGTYAITLTARDTLGNRSQIVTTVTAGDFSLYLPIIFKNYSSQAVNHAPVAISDTATTLEDAPVSIDVLANDSDPDSDTLTISRVGTPTHGTTSSGATIIYTPAHTFTGTDVFTYAASDGLLTDTATVSVTVNTALQLYLPLIMK